MPTTRASTQSTSSKPLKSDVEYLNSLVAAVPDTDTDSDSPEPEGDDSGSGNTCAPSGNDSDYRKLTTTTQTMTSFPERPQPLQAAAQRSGEARSKGAIGADGSQGLGKNRRAMKRGLLKAKSAIPALQLDRKPPAKSASMGVSSCSANLERSSRVPIPESTSQTRHG
jgi:hypothetical protein